MKINSYVIVDKSKPYYLNTPLPGMMYRVKTINSGYSIIENPVTKREKDTINNDCLIELDEENIQSIINARISAIKAEAQILEEAKKLLSENRKDVVKEKAKSVAELINLEEDVTEEDVIQAIKETLTLSKVALLLNGIYLE